MYNIGLNPYLCTKFVKNSTLSCKICDAGMLYIKGPIRTRRMKKSFLLWMGVVLMMVVGMSSCSGDDETTSIAKEINE